MAEPHVDNPGELRWLRGYGPAPVLGPCPHVDCRHLGRSVIADGPSLDRYELMQCDDADCGTSCRAWADGRGRTTTAWLHVAWADERLLKIMAVNRA